MNSFPSTTSTRTSGLHEELLVDNTPVDVTETGGERESFEEYQEDFNDDSV